MKIKKLFSYFSLFEWSLWLGSLTMIVAAFLMGGSFNPLTLVSSLVGASSLIFLAKGNVVGQLLMIIFSLLYGILSFGLRYYGEMVTYVFMTLPSAVVACITWLKHPSHKGSSEVAVAAMTKRKWIFLLFATLLSTFIFYFILKYFNTANLVLSTVSVATSFLAASLSIFRSPYYALGYAANDLVLIGLWISASIKTISYLPMVFCFLTFLLNDLYGFISWRKMESRQHSDSDRKP